jgi:hypothetical protein
VAKTRFGSTAILAESADGSSFPAAGDDTVIIEKASIAVEPFFHTSGIDRTQGFLKPRREAF